MIRKRAIALISVAALTLVYQWLNKTVSGGWVPRLPVDDWIPLWPIWVLPYLLTLPGLLLVGVIGARRMDEAIFRQFALMMIWAMLLCYLCFAIMPTYVERPALHGDDWATRILQTLYTQDHPNNACPSLHIALTASWCLTWCIWQPNWRWLWRLIALIIALSTILTHQHYILDVIGGVLVAWLAQISARLYLKSCKPVS